MSLKAVTTAPSIGPPTISKQRAFLDAVEKSGLIDTIKPEVVDAFYKELTARGYFIPSPPPETAGDLLSKRLGPTFAELNPGATDDRTNVFSPISRPATAPNIDRRVNPFEVGVAPSIDSDFWTSVGQVAYAPDDPLGVGLDRVQTFAYYCHVFATSPRFDGAPEPFSRQHFISGVMIQQRQPICAVRNYAGLSNEGLVIYKGGLLAPAGTQTGRGGAVGFDWPIPDLQIPKEKTPAAMALTGYNEFCLVAVHDEITGKGQLAVIMCEGKCIPFHTLQWIGLPNQGSWSDFKLLGYVDLPFAYPDSVSAASNGKWNGPSQTGGKTLGQIDITSPGTRWGLRQGDLGWQMVIAKGGYAIVSSKTEGKVCIVDLTPLFQWVRRSYLDDDKQAATIAARSLKTWPVPLSLESTPIIALTLAAQTPTCVLAGCFIDRWSKDRHKAYFATEAGTIFILDTSSLLARWDWEKVGPLIVIGNVIVGRNPVSMAFARFEQWGTPLIPKNDDGTPNNADPLNNIFHVVCRGDRRIESVVTMAGDSQVYQKIEDARLIDPVHVSVADRGNIMMVSDFAGKKIVSYRIGPLFNRVDQWGKQGERWDCGPVGAAAAYECAGVLPLPGRPFWTGSSNLN